MAKRKRKKKGLHLKRLLALLVLLVLAALGIYGYACSRIVHVDYVDAYISGLSPFLEGTRVLFASDFKITGEKSARDSVKLMQTLCEANPDIVLLGGDYTGMSLSDLFRAQTQEGRAAINDRLKSARTKGFEDSPKIALMGLWDVVSSRHDVYKGFFNGMKAPVVERVRHAMAIDERRELFPVMHYFPDDSIVQVWFPGVHSEVGGGYDDDKVLYRLSYEWMVAESAKACLAFVEPVECKKIDWRTLKPYIPPLSGKHPCRCYWPEDEFHQSVNERAAATFKPVEFANFEPDEINANIGSVA